MCSLFSVYTLFYLILESMSASVRKFSLPCYIWHLITSCIIDPFLCCHRLYLIIYLVRLSLLLTLKKGKTFEAFKKHFRTNLKLDFGISKKQSSQILKLFSWKRKFEYLILKCLLYMFYSNIKLKLFLFKLIFWTLQNSHPVIGKLLKRIVYFKTWVFQSL